MTTFITLQYARLGGTIEKLARVQTVYIKLVYVNVNSWCETQVF